MAEAYLAALNGATNADEAARVICSAVESRDLFAFAELFYAPAVISLKQSSTHVKFYNLLELFAYGIYEEYLTTKVELPVLTDAMILKLRELTLVSVATQHRCIPVDEAMRILHIDSISDMEAVFISALYTGIIQGRWDAQANVLDIISFRNRDVHPEELESICAKLQCWIEQCAGLSGTLKEIAEKSEKAISDSNARETKVEEEVKKIRKAIQDEEEQKGAKDARRAKPAPMKERCAATTKEQRAKKSTLL